MGRRVAAAVAAVVLAAAGGCGPAACTISGAVLADGKPLEKGVIMFAPADGQGEPATADVTGGRYEVRTTPGRKRVQLSAPVVTGRRKLSNAPDAQTVDITEESLPAKYNAVSELTFDAAAGGNSKDWAVESIPRKK